MSFPASVTAPSPLPDQMGCVLHDGGCTFRAYAIFATAISVKIWASDGVTTNTFPLAKDTADGYGSDVWSVFLPGVIAETNYRYVVTFTGGSAERADPFARSIVYPNWTDATQDDSDARSVVTSRDFSWGAPFSAPGWRELVIYQLHVGTFFDPTQGGASKMDDLIDQIPYLQALGVNAVQFLPFVEFSAPLSLGYDTVLPFAMERDYGKPQDFMRLVQALHAAKMSVLVDVVYNHIDVAPSFTAPPFPYSLFQWDGWGGDPCGIYFYGGDEMDTPWGPRPNYGRAAVARYLGDNAMMWLSEYQVDGIRFDSTGCIRLRQGNCGTFCCGSDIGVERNFGWELMAGINDRVDAGQPWKLTIAEDLNDNGAITNPTSSGGAGFDAQWDTDLQSALIAAITEADDSWIDVGAVAFKMQNPSEGDPFKRIIYLESHDQADGQRVPAKVFPSDPENWYARKKSILGFAVILTTPGIPMFFQGAELLDGRTWSPGGSNPTMMDFTRQKKFPNLFQFYCDMVRLRIQSPGLAGSGLNVFQANPATKVLAYHRWNQGSGNDDLVVVANFSGTSFPSYTIGFPYPGTWRVRLNSDANAYSDSNDFGSVNSYDTQAGPGGWDGMPYVGNVGIGPYSMIVLSR
ncbi:MAG TPA: alpha-amylase family glycosyl hydrolase [Tepidisphaeraceae bacterium]|nr:alpha-amylase family glycosyl hydrolase [Tepidisphaeraceae bacterium]